jgi:hypothetical protein
VSALFTACAPRLVHAHAPNENYVWLNIEQSSVSGRFEFDSAYIEDKLGIDWRSQGDTEEEALANVASEVWRYLTENFSIIANGQSIPLIFEGTSIAVEGLAYAQFRYRTDPFDIPDTLTLNNGVFLEEGNFLHRSLIVLEYNKRSGSVFGSENAVIAFGLHNTEQELNLLEPPQMLLPKQFLWQGILHAVLGFDHVLFLIALLFTAVLVRVMPAENGQIWRPVDRFQSALWNVLKIVTIFTISHSITLSLSVLGLIEGNTQLIETLIAFSIVIVAMNNVFPKFNDKKWLLILLFGLVHGMGFASAMSDLQFRTGSITKILIGFNVGIELGQIIIVLLLFPIFFAIRGTVFYRIGVVTGGSLVIAAIAAYWTIERAFGL